MAGTATIAWINNPAPVMFAAVQTSAQVNGVAISQDITMSSPTTVGNLVVVHIYIAATTICSSVADDKGNTYVLSSQLLDGSGNSIYQAYGVQVTGGATIITVTLSSSDFFICGADEYSGGANSNAGIFDVSTTGTAVGSNGSVSTLTPALAGELIVATYHSNAAGSGAAGANYVNFNGAAGALGSIYRLSSSTSETAPITFDAAGRWMGIATAFKH